MSKLTPKNKKIAIVGLGLAAIVGFYFLNKKYNWIGSKTTDSETETTDATAPAEEPVYKIPAPTANTAANLKLVKKATAGRG